uniref:INO80 complex subunit B-like conserved region domain-containing protein n=1 Tax=Anthurium amnicola TaxID=1678845 RepID=A0A1D1YVS3_9ARAE
MEELGVSGFSGITGVAKKRRSTTSRRPRPDSLLVLEGRDPSPPSSTPSSENASKQSTDGSSSHDASVRRKEVNLNSLVPTIPSVNRSDGAIFSRRIKKDDKSSGEFDGYYGSGVQRPGIFRSNAPNHGLSDFKRSSEGVLSPANWKGNPKRKDRLSPDNHIGSGSRADAPLMGQSEPGTNGSAENKLRKVKLKVGGVTRTIHAKSNGESSIEGGGSAKPPRPDASRHRRRLSLKAKSDDDSFQQDKRDALQGAPWKDFSDVSFSSASKESSTQGKRTDDIVSRKQVDKAHSMAAFEPVRKSKRVPKRRVLDGAFDGEDEDEEIRYLERLKISKFTSDHSFQHDDAGSEGNKKQKTSKVSKRVSYEEDEDFSLSRRSKEGRKKSRSERESQDMDYVEEEEAGSDVSESKRKKQRKESLDSLSDSRKEFSLTTRQRALQSGKDGSGGSNNSLIEFPNGLPPAPPRKQKGKLSEVDQQLKKAEAAQRRRMQVEKAARESEAEAIRKILGQDSSRKKREEKMQKKRDELAQVSSSNDTCVCVSSFNYCCLITLN